MHRYSPPVGRRVVTDRDVVDAVSAGRILVPRGCVVTPLARVSEIISLRRGACTLHGSGVIGLGAPPSEPISPCVRFEVMKFADTQRGQAFDFGLK